MVSPLSLETLETPPELAAASPAGAPASPVLGRLRSSLPESFQSYLHSAREISRARREEAAEHPPLPTAVPALDRLLDGGLPRGRLVELVGGRSSGRFSALLAALAAATSVGEAAALVDLGDALDPAAVAALGADLARLLWVRPTTLRQAVAAAEMLLGTGFPLVVLDLGHPPVRGGRGAEAVWLRLARTARLHDSALLVGSPYRVSGTAAAAVLKAERAHAVWQGGDGSPWLLGGVSACFAMEKHRGRAAEGKSAELELKVAESPSPPAPLPSPPLAVPARGENLRKVAFGRFSAGGESLRAAGGRR
jgi:RecA DNA recombination protein